ncbi:hypothetical protein [Bradyrhizobium sp. 18]|uniref:hypothetical protein n=1 Tax=Bradyrhizobium sp. 18 TaxID=2782657 RepID=UPI001FF7B765|nr:hypothetical protein [Bradyrhizobium sp. 18]MCK1503851.1 hypothetical protein [Bradyrhizobium sp. 18]
MVAWLLIVSIGASTVAVPNIATLNECEGLALRLAPMIEKTPDHKCIEYRTAKVMTERPEILVVPMPSKD